MIEVIRKLMISLALSMAVLLVPASVRADMCTVRSFSFVEEEVLKAYLGYYGRHVDLGGFTYWSERFESSGGNLSVIIEPFGVSAEFNDRFGRFAEEDLITNLYRQLLGREPDTAGLAFYANALAGGRITLQSIALDVLYGAINEDVFTIENRLEISKYVTSCMEQNLLEFPPIEMGVSLLGSVGADQASLEEAIALVDDWIDQPGNQSPYAGSLSFLADNEVVYVEAQLAGYDPDGDIINYHLLSDPSGAGYTNAYVGSESGRLYMTLDGSASAISLEYNVTDGQLFSDTATISLHVVDEVEEKGRGAESVDVETYASFTVIQPWGELLGTPDSDPTVPRAIDLSASFPLPGDQGQQGSCVGWATAYAIKSYSAKRDIGWEIDRLDHVFSPAFVFNAVALPGCDGSYPNEVLDRMQHVGVSTWSEMPYSDAECRSQPSAAALSQATNFKIESWGTLRTVDDIKAQLANHSPVLLGIHTYPSFSYLSGEDSLYNDFSGTSGGGHAIAMVGYDDDRYGGAFKVINSWGTNWGDEGFFWYPYDAISNGAVTMAVYSLVDGANTDDVIDPVDPPPSPSGDLPNLVVRSWSAQYDPRPGGTGQLYFEIGNSGIAAAEAGAYVNLMLSKDQVITGNDTFVIYEPIPFELEPGGTAYRDRSNFLRFVFPDPLSDGLYQMALWVDDLDSVEESNEMDNVSFGDPVQIENSLPDLAIETWYAEWFGFNGTLTYDIINQGLGTAGRGWDVNLMLSVDQMLGNADDYYLAYETIPFDLTTSETVYRDSANPLQFDLYGVLPGYYRMALWVDDMDQVEESNERNNSSWGWEPVYIGLAGLSAKREAATADEDGGDTTESFAAEQGGGQLYNGRRLPSQLQVYRVMISATDDGGRELTILEDDEASGPRVREETVRPSKINAARNPRAFPVSAATPMPLDVP